MDNNCSKKKIAIFTVSMGCGGAERVISRIIPKLSEVYDVVLILLDSSRIEFDVNIPIISLGKKEPSNRFKYVISLIKSGIAFRQYIFNNDLECVVSFLSTPNIINILCNKKCKRIISVRGQISVDGTILTKLKQFVEKMIYKRADRVIVPSKSLKNDLVNLCKLNEDYVSVIYNPFDIDEIACLSNEKIDNKYIQLYENSLVITALGRMTYEKGFDHLLQVLALVMKSTKKVKLIIIGDGKEKRKLIDLSKRLEVEKHVIFTGQMSNPFPYIKKSELFVMSSVSEGFPNALVEALACGVPVISTDCKSGPREILFKNADLERIISEKEYAEYGIITPSFSKKDVKEQYTQMAESILLLLRDKNMNKKYKAVAMERARMFSVERCVEEFVKVIG